MPIESGPPIMSLADLYTWGIEIFLSICGAFMRAARWRDEKTGKIVYSRVLVEVPIAIATASVAGGLGDYMHWDIKIIYGVCGVLGLLGPPFFTGLGETILSVIRSRFGKADNGDKGHEHARDDDHDK